MLTALLAFFWNDLVSETGLFEVAVQVDELIRADRDRVVHRTFEIVGLQHVEDRQFLFTQRILSGEVDHHLVYHAVCLTA